MASATTSTHVRRTRRLWRVQRTGEIYECGCADIPEGDCDCDGNVLDECGICGGDGIPAGDCDCDGNQLDALGECGGPCEADADADGICDDVDPCVGELDACGVCNGPGEIYECGCADIPEGDCDCDGNVLDECGICGGDGIPAGDCDCDGNQLDALGECGGPCEPMRTPMASATTSTHVSENSTLVACATDQARSTSADALTSLKEIATVTETSLTSAASVAVTASLPETATAMATSLTPLENAEVLVSRCGRRWHLRRRRPMCRRTRRCGVCNGPGEIYECGCALTSLKETATGRQRP